MEACILFVYTSKLFTPKKTLPQQIICLAVAYAALVLLQQAQISILNIVGFFISTGVFLYICYDVTVPETFLHTTLITIMMCASEILVTMIVSQYSLHFYQQSDFLHDLLILGCLSKLLYYIFIILLIIFFSKRNTSSCVVPKGSIWLLITAFISIVFTMLLIFICETYTVTSSMKTLILLCTALIILTNLIIFFVYSYMQRQSMDYIDLQLRLQRESDNAAYQRQLAEEDENQKILIHDIRKHLRIITAYSEARDYNRLTAYVNEISASDALRPGIRSCDHPLLNSILSRYKRQCQEYGIDLHTDIRARSIDFLSDSDITSIFCNLLDNAVHAASQAACPASETSLTQAFIELNITINETVSLTLIILVNSCQTNPFPTIKARKNPHAGEHGFGLVSIRKTVEKYGGNLQMYYEESNHSFHTVIAIPNLSNQPL